MSVRHNHTAMHKGTCVGRVCACVCACKHLQNFRNDVLSEIVAELTLLPNIVTEAPGQVPWTKIPYTHVSSMQTYDVCAN